MTAIQLRTLKKYLEDSSFTHTEEWLTACVEWVKENCVPVTDAVLRSQVHEQWQDANLEDMESRCLPPNLASQKCVKLTGRYGLQVNAFQDIGESAYNQWNRIKKLENENTSVAATDSNDVKPSWEPKPRRCLYLTLTDGSQKVYGLELTPIAALSLNLKPGTKIVVSGPVECRRGVIQLKPPNVKVIGGEVEDLLETNSVEALLREILHNPPESTNVGQESTIQRSNNVIGDFPDSLDVPDEAVFDDDDIFMEIDETELLASHSLTNSERTNTETQKISVNRPIPSNSVQPPPRTMIPSSDPKSRVNTNIRNETSVSGQSMPPPRIPNPPAKNLSKFESPVIPKTTKINSNIMTNSGVKRPIASSSSASKSSKSSATASAKSKKQLKIDGYMKPMPVIIKPRTPIKDMDIPEENSNANPEDSIILESDDDDDALMDIIEGSFAAELEKAELESKLTESVRPKNEAVSVPLKSPPLGVVRPTSTSRVAVPINVSRRPYIYIKQIHDEWDRLEGSEEIVRVKACIATVVSNIQVSDGFWTLTVCINDGTGFLNCRISANILNGIIGFTPAEMKKIKSTKTPEAKEKIANGMGNLASMLVHMNSIFGIELRTDPVIVEFGDVMLNHITALKERVSHIS